MVDQIALPPPHSNNSPIAIPAIVAGQFDDPGDYFILVISLYRLVPHACAMQLQCPAGTALRQMIFFYILSLSADAALPGSELSRVDIL